ncbi:MAG TPA: hypothetical protein VI172_08170 [Candidatus Dormibacteraeota bacterium]
MTYDEFKAAGARDMKSRLRHTDGTEALLVGVIPPGMYACASSMSAVAYQDHYAVMVDIGPGPRPMWDLVDVVEVL